MPEAFHPGQRWLSESEPELGLGAVRRVEARTVTIVFGASSETREYARDNAPLRRVRFRAGDSIRHRDGESGVVQAVAERGGLLYYRVVESAAGEGAGTVWPETELSDTVSSGGPEERWRAGQF